MKNPLNYKIILIGNNQQLPIHFDNNYFKFIIFRKNRIINVEKKTENYKKKKKRNISIFFQIYIYTKYYIKINEAQQNIHLYDSYFCKKFINKFKKEKENELTIIITFFSIQKI